VRYLVDTTVLLEIARPQPERRVVEWLQSQIPLDIGVSVLSVGEIERAIAGVQNNRRRSALERWMGDEFPRQFQGRLLAFDEATAREWGRLAARARISGRDLPLIDGLLLATASFHGLTLVTRNEADCAARGVPVLNPWREG
jgi:predicted nucleic acid-binding protein